MIVMFGGFLFFFFAIFFLKKEKEDFALEDAFLTLCAKIQVGAQSARMKMTRVPVHGGFFWHAYDEETASNDESSFTLVGLLEQINTTRDASDYLWYSTE